MPVFDNVRLDYRNFSFGPDPGRIYHIDHVSDSLIVKTYPGGALITTIPLSVSIKNEILSLEYDGYYFYALSNIGTNGDLGVRITKWLLTGSSVVKQLGTANEIIFSNTSGIEFNSKAICVQTYTTFLSFFVNVGDSQITLNNVSNLNIGDSVYLGPSNASLGERIERTVTSIVGTVVTLDSPVNVQFNQNDQVIYRKNIWMFNNGSLYNPTNGSLLQVNSYTGYTDSIYSSAEWKHVTAATGNNGDLVFIRASQLLKYRPFGPNSGYQYSAFLQNIEVDNKTIIPVVDMAMDDSFIYKLQNKQHVFNDSSFEFEDIESLTGRYEIEQEQISAKVVSLTTIRDKSIYSGRNILGGFIVKVRDQYNTPIFNRNISIQENDPSGFIEPGYSSFTTDLEGKGLTKYNSGVSPGYNNPLISIVDIISNWRVNVLIEQSPGIDGKVLLEQYGGIDNKTYIEQTKVSSEAPLIQGISVDNKMPIEQLNSLLIRIPLTQDLTSGNLLIEQTPSLLSESFIQQNPAVSDITTVTQYNFLILAIPEPYSLKNKVNSTILVRIVGFGGIPLDSSTLTFKVNGIDVTNLVIVTPFSGGLELFYTPLDDFKYSSTVLVEIDIEDTDNPPKTISTNYTFNIVSDTKKPFLGQIYPPDLSVYNDPYTEVYAIVKDLETGINQDTIEFYIEGKQVIPTISEPNPGEIKVSYKTTESFYYESNIYAAILAADNEGNKFVGTWSFEIKPSNGVLFINREPDQCDVLVPIDTNVCLEAFGLEDGINLNSLTFSVDGKKVTYVLRPKIYRKE